MSNIAVQRVPKVEDRTLPIFAEIDELMRAIRERAFRLSATRGFDPGHALDDWLVAEREVCWPAAEVVERGAEFVVSVALPGFEPADIALTATPQELLVHARFERRAESKADERTVWSDFRSNDVYRRIAFEKPIDVDKVSATLKNGLLKIVATKVEKPARPVPVAAAA